VKCPPLHVNCVRRIPIPGWQLSPRGYNTTIDWSETNTDEIRADHDIIDRLLSSKCLEALALAILSKCSKIGSHLPIHLASHQVSFLPTTTDQQPRQRRVYPNRICNIHSTSLCVCNLLELHQRVCHKKAILLQQTQGDFAPLYSK